MSQVCVAPVVVVTGANGLVGARICAELSGRGAEVRAVVRRAGTAPSLPAVTERVGEFSDPAFAAEVVAGVDVAITTVHPLDGDLETQRRIGVQGTAAFARAAAAAGVPTLVHISTAAVYDRSPSMGDADEASPLVADDAGDYPVTKREVDAVLATIEGMTRVLVRPPAVLGPGDTSVWNSLRPAAIRDDEGARHAVAGQTFAWVHVEDLARFAADLATGQVAGGPAPGSCTAVNLAGEPATVGDYYRTVTAALGIEPVWDDAPVWTGQILTQRASSWGWQPAVGLLQALAELDAGLRG